MSFFKPPPPPPLPERPTHSGRQPGWIGPPGNVLPGIVPVQLIMAWTEDAVIAVTGVRAYPNGLDLTLSVRLRRGRGEPWLEHGPFDDPFFLAGGRLRAEFLRFGVRFADGRKATNLVVSPLDEDQDPQAPVLLPTGGSGAERRLDAGYWLWPLPPPGVLGFACAWPARDIPESLVEVDTGPMLEKAGRAVILWPEDDGPTGEPGWTGRTWGTFYESR